MGVFMDSIFKKKNSSGSGKWSCKRENITLCKLAEEEKHTYVVTADKGFRKSFRDDKEIVTFDSLNKFLNYVIIHTKYLAEAVDRQIGSDVIDGFIKDNIVDEVYTANCDVDGCYDDFDIIGVEYRSHKVGYTNIVEDSLAEVTLEITAEIRVEYTERDEENSYYDKEDGRYLFEEFVQIQETHEVSFEANLDLYIDNLDEEEWTGDKLYTTCPACGKPISHQNDGGNGFCIDCAWKH